MKKIQWVNNNHMRFDSLHKTYNKKVDCLSTGNVIGDGQLSFYIRPYEKTECNGFTSDKGHLQDFDLENFRRNHTLPEWLLEQVKEYTKKDNAILYAIRHYTGSQKVVHGAILTTAKYKEEKLLRVWYLNNSYKSQSVIDEAVKYLTV